MKETLEKFYPLLKDVNNELAIYLEFQVGKKQKMSYKKLKS